MVLLSEVCIYMVDTCIRLVNLLSVRVLSLGS